MNKKYIMASLLAFTAWNIQAQEMTIVSDMIDCGQVVYRAPVTAEFEIKNSGVAPLVINDVRSGCGCTTADYPQGPIQPGGKFIVKATYDAKQMGHFNKQIAVYSNGSPTPLILSVRGVVVKEIVDFAGQYTHRLGQLMVDMNDIEFDNVNRGDRPSQKIHVKNVGTETARPVIMHLPDFLKAEVSPSRIAPGHGGTITLMLDSYRLRDFGLTQTSVYLGAFLGDKVAPEKEITVSTVLLPGFENLTDGNEKHAPQMRLSADSLDLGSLNGKRRKKGTIEIFNEGHLPLKINSLQMFTTGLEVSLNKTTIEPGEKAKLKVTAIAAGLKRARSKPRVLMITNDPKNAKVVINIHVKQ